MGRACSTNGEKMNAYRLLVEKAEGKRPLGRPRRKLVNIVKMYLRYRMVCMDWADVAQDRGQWRALVNTAMNFRVS
jgi:hypothetical protein